MLRGFCFRATCSRSALEFSRSLKGWPRGGDACAWTNVLAPRVGDSVLLGTALDR